jgi:uncharacterized protein DUF2806
MVDNAGKPASKGRGVSLPGQSTEEAIAEVGSEAGKSLVRGFSRLGSAYISEWAVTREAKAEAARLAIDTDAKIKADKDIANARRDQEAADFDHRAALERRAQRFRIEMAREQINLEAIERRALEYVEVDPKNIDARELDEDWLFRFADFAQKVSDRDVQSLWARALSSAVIQGGARLSAAALQTLGLFDKDVAENFRKFVAAVSAVGFVPYTPDGEADPQQIDLTTLSDLGLIEVYFKYLPYEYEDFALKEGYELQIKPPLSHRGLTKRGYDIAVAVFAQSEELQLSQEHEEKYFQHLLCQLMQGLPLLTISPKLNETEPLLQIGLTNKSGSDASVHRPDWKSVVGARLSPRLVKLLVWAENNYDIQIANQAMLCR